MSHAGTVAGSTSLKKKHPQHSANVAVTVTRKATSQSSAGVPIVHSVDNERSDDEEVFFVNAVKT